MRSLALAAFAFGVLIGVVYGALGLAQSSPTDTISSAFGTLPPGADLPTGQECAEQVDTRWEPVPQNGEANQTVPDELGLRPWRGFDPRAAALVARIDGDFTGTTDAILQWGACKWGIDVELVRAMAFQESRWSMAAEGDVEEDPALCPPGREAPCPTSFGLLQIKWYYHAGTYPHSARATAFNVDYTLAHLRACFEGWAYHRGSYEPGDVWGCVGAHYSGEWETAGARRYIADVQRHVNEQPWLAWLATVPGAHGAPVRG